MIQADQCEVKPLFFELPAQAHPAPGHQLHLHHGGDHSTVLILMMLVKMMVLRKMLLG